MVRKAVIIILALSLSGCYVQAKSKVKEQLIDPYSAQFENMVTKNGVVCGTVNSKNLMGAYTGPRGFIVDDNKVTIETSEYNEEFYSELNKCPGLQTAIIQIWGARAARY